MKVCNGWNRKRSGDRLPHSPSFPRNVALRANCARARGLSAWTLRVLWSRRNPLGKKPSGESRAITTEELLTHFRPTSLCPTFALPLGRSVRPVARKRLQKERFTQEKQSTFRPAVFLARARDTNLSSFLQSFRPPRAREPFIRPQSSRTPNYFFGSR